MDDNFLLFSDDSKIKEFANQIAESIKDNEGNELNIIHQLLKDKLQSIKMHIDILKSQLDEEKRKLLKVNSPAYQARKMYGDTVPGDVTHSDVSRDFSDYFKHYSRNLPKLNPNISSDRVKKWITPFFQDAYHISRDHALGLIKDQVSTLFDDPSSFTDEYKDSVSTREERGDTSRAYALLLHHARNKTCKETILKQLELKIKDTLINKDMRLSGDIIERTAKLTWEMVSLIPPAISATPTKYNDITHEQRHAHWTIHDGSYELVYYRPVLYFGEDAYVAHCGQVGNEACSPSSNALIDEEFHNSSNDMILSLTDGFESVAKELIQEILTTAQSKVSNQ